MIKYNKHTNLLETQIHKYTLQDVAEPVLYRDIFDFETIPKIAFNSRIVPMNMPDDIWITDTTFRDGQQSTAPFTVEQIKALFKMMSQLGGKKGIVRQSEFFLYSEKDKAAAQECMQMGLKFPQVTAWIRASEKDFELVKNMDIKETGILVSCSDYHIFKKMNLTRKSALDKYLGVVKSALSHGIVPRCHFEDITRADIYGFVVPFALELMKLSKESGIPIKIRACDTLGYGATFPGMALPRSVQGIIYALNYYGEVPSAQLEWHGHNDFYKVVSNATVAWLYGCAAVNCSLLGIGERTGNCPLEAMAVEYASLKGTTDGMNLHMITKIAEYFEKEIGYNIPQHTPFVGRSFNTTRAGIHADGMLKDDEIYNIFNTEKILGRKPLVSINEHSGLSGIAYWLNSFYEIPKNAAIAKQDPLVARIAEMVAAEYKSGRTTVMGDDELDGMVRIADKKRHKVLSIGESK